jgi:hypothetical protein
LEKLTGVDRKMLEIDTLVSKEHPV